MIESPTYDALNDLLELKPGWDGYSAPQIDVQATAAAREFLYDVPCERPPRVVPTAMGGVQFEWSWEGRELEIEFLPDGTAGYLAVETKEQSERQFEREGIDAWDDGWKYEATRLMEWLF